MRQSIRIIVNSVATFARMAVNIGIGLLTTRILLQQLGALDYGFMIAIGATLALYSIITASLRSSCARLLGLESGVSDNNKQALMFQTIFAVFFGFGLCMLFLSLLVEPWITAGLQIPEERIASASTVFYLAALNMAIIIAFTTPEVALIAEQRLVAVACFQVVEAVLKGCAAVSVFFLPYDKLLTYMSVLTVLNLLLQLVRLGATFSLLPYARRPFVAPKFDYIKQIFSFSRWTGLQTAANYCRQDAAIVLINLTFGPAVNALYAVAHQVSVYIRNFGMALETVLLPASIKSEGAGVRDSALQIAFTGEKFTLLLVSFIVVPLLIEMPYFLLIWLGDTTFQSSMSEFSRWLVITSMLGITTRAYAQVLFGEGNYGHYAKVQFYIAIAALVIASVLVAAFERGPLAIPITLCASSLVLNVFRVIHVSKRLSLSAARWLRQVLYPVISVVLPSGLISMVIWELLPQSGLRAILVIASYSVVALVFLWRFGCTESERTLLAGLLRRKFPMTLS